MTTHDRCPVCRATLSPNASICHVCGSPLLSHSERSDAESEPQAERTNVQAEILALLARMDHRLSDIERRAEASDQRLLRLEGRQVQPTVVQAREKPPAAPPVVAPPPPPPPPTPLLEPISSFKPVAVSSTPTIAQKPAPASPIPAVPVTSPRGGKTASDWERLVGGSGLAWTGALALIIGAVFFLSLAFSRGWIGPSARVIIGVAVATLCIAGGAWFFNRREALFGYALSAVGLGVMSLSMYAATQLYDLVRIEIGLAGALFSAIAAAMIAIRFNAPIVAAFGIIAALAAPPILGASTNGTTILYLGATLVGVAAISLYRSWNWLPLLAFVLAAPQAGVWISDAQRAAGFVALGAFWLLFTISACGPEYRTHQISLKSSSPILLFLNAIFLVQSGFMLLDTETMMERWGGHFLFIVALAHGAVGAFFIRKYGDRHPFALLAAWFGLIAFAVAVPIQFNGPVVAIIWAAVAIPFSWYADRHDHRSSRVAGILLFALSIVHLFAIEYQLGDIDTGLHPARPFLNAEAGTLAAILAALAITGYLVRSATIRSNLTVIGCGLVLLAMPFELDNTALITGWAVVAVLALALSRLPIVQTTWLAPGFDKRARIESLLADMSRKAWPRSGGGRELLAITAGLLGIGHLMRFELPYRQFADWVRPEPPFADRPTLTVAIMVLAMALAIIATPFVQPRRGILIAAAALVAYLLPFQVSWPTVVLGWSMLGLALLAATRYDPAGSRAYLLSNKLMLVAGLIPALVIIAPPNRLTVDAASVIDHPLLWSGATVALGSLAIAFGVSAWMERPGQSRLVMAVLAGTLAIYLGSVAIVDEFQRRVGSGTDLDSLKKRAQVALSIFWAITGGLIFAAGIVRFGQAVRVFGLALLALATAKVFVYDLSSLDASYRVLSFVGLGILLLISSYLYQHFVVTNRLNDGPNGDDTPSKPDGPPHQHRWHVHRAH